MKKYNLSEIMKSAWATFRKTNWSFSKCLRNAWIDAKMLAVGNLWEKYGKRRIYFNAPVLKEICGLETYCYNSGNLMSCYIDGEHISNSEGYRWLGSFESFYYDVVSDKFCGRGSHFHDVVRKVKSFLGIRAA